MRPLAPAVALACCLAAPAFAESAGSIAPPPPGHWAVDTTRKIRSGTLGEIDRIATAADASGRGQIAVLVVSTTSGADARQFATDVFNRWGIGHAGRNDGALLFVALADRAAEIVLGDGVDDDADVRRSDAAMAQVVGRFKLGDPNGALLVGTRGLSRLLDEARINAQGAEAQRAQPPEATAVKPFVLPKVRPGWVADPDNIVPAEVERRLNELSWELESERQPPIAWIFYDSSEHSAPPAAVESIARYDPWISTSAWVLVAAARGAAVHLAAPRTTTTFHEIRSDQERLEQMWSEAMLGLSREGLAGRDRVLEVAANTKEFTTTNELPLPVGERASELVSENPVPVCGGGALALVASIMGLSHWNRRRPRRCNACGSQRELLDERADDVHLTRGQLAEEQLKSVDYDVWWCPRCNDALVLRYGKFLTGYSRCPQCQFVTSRQTTRTLVSATYDHGGEVEVTEHCQQCGYHDTFRRYTARLTRSSSSSSSHSSSFGHSSSSRSSFGGGSSSGRGSSGRW